MVHFINHCVECVVESVKCCLVSYSEAFQGVCLKKIVDLKVNLLLFNFIMRHYSIHLCTCVGCECKWL
jgi:hypothetical protein